MPAEVRRHYRRFKTLTLDYGTEFTSKALGHLTPSEYAKAGQKRNREVTKF